MLVQVEEVKAAVESGFPTTSTLTTLRDLLGVQVDQGSQGLNKATIAGRNGQNAKAISARNANSAATKSKRPVPVTIREDIRTGISGREKYALATHVVNHSLKQLASSLKVQPKLQDETTSSVSENTHSTPDLTPPRALQPRSANISPVRPSPKKPSINGVKSAHSTLPSANEASLKALAVAQCAQLGFSFLLNADFQALGVRELPRWQLETGLLSLVGSLISHGLDGQAVKQLRVVKHRFEAALGNSRPVTATKLGRSKPVPPNHESLAALLRLKASFDSDPAALNIAIAYQQHVLRLLSRDSAFTVLNELPKHVAIEVANGPVDLIIRQAKATKDFAKAAKQLQALSQTILSLGPSVASTEDASARDGQRSPQPEAMLRLQTIGLQIRKLWWKLAKHQADIDHELLEPFLKCITAFVRRLDLDNANADNTALLRTCLDSIGPFESTTQGQSLFPIHQILCCQATSEGKMKEALKLAETMAENCVALDRNHARVIAALVQQAMLLDQVSTAEQQRCLTAATDSLQSKIKGTNADYDMLVDAIESLSRSMYHHGKQAAESPNLVRVLSLGAMFCQRYARSYPGRNTQKIISILEGTLRHSCTTEDLLAWVTQDSVQVLVQAGALKVVAETAATRPLVEVWSSSREGLLFSRIVNALLLKAMRSSADSSPALLFDDEKLHTTERGTLLEWQLQCASDLSSRIKYHEPLKKLLPEVLRRLAKTYTPSEFPLRRIRVATIAFGIREANPNLIPPHLFKVWHDSLSVDSNGLGQDHGLAGYHGDLVARFATLKLFSEGQPTVEELKPHLINWKRIVCNGGDVQALYDHCDDSKTLQQQLRSIATYHRMQGDDAAALPVYQLLAQLDQLLRPHKSDVQASRLSLAECYLSLGYAGRSAQLLGQPEPVTQLPDKPDVNVLEQNILYAEYLIDVDKLEQCALALAQTGDVRSHLAPETVHREQRRTYESLHARSWLLQSRLLLATGCPQESLRAGKRAVQILNSIWSSIERSTGTSGLATSTEPTFDDDQAVNGLAKGISKLQLTPPEHNKSDSNPRLNKRGAAFWSVMPILMKALLHLSNVYTHHGLFNEADYYSQRAISVAESVESRLLLSRVRNHRCRLLTLAGRTEDAELCTVQDGNIGSSPVSFAHVDRCCTKAMLKLKEGCLPNALELYEEAEQALDTMIPEEFLAKLECFNNGDGHTAHQQSIAAFSSMSEPLNGIVVLPTSKAVKRPARKPISKTKQVVERSRNTELSYYDASQNSLSNNDYVLQKMKDGIAVEKALICLCIGERSNKVLDTLTIDRRIDTFRKRLLQHRSLVHKATEMLQANVTLGLLTESTLSLPGLTVLDCRPSETKKKSLVNSGSKKIAAKAPGKSTKTSEKLKERPESLLFAARDCFSDDQPAKSNLFSTTKSHLAGSCVSNASLLVSAIADSQQDLSITPANEAMRLDVPRNKALQLEKVSVAVDREAIDDPRQITWPDVHPSSGVAKMSGSEFQEKFVDILPTPWTAVSLCLSEDYNDLYIARYRSGVAPFTVKLPFSRHKPDEDDCIDESAFDYHKGKAELQEIIGLSNYTCHNPGNLEAKGAKTKWWKNREDLDRRLHELLINVENIWFGGFKAIFSQHQSRKDALLRFRALFDQVLARHLPSRRTGKSKTDNFVLDDQVLELFIGLETVKGVTSDLDEPVTDLLYYVIDMLQFKGERNAYDEIDFDSMTIDVLDTLHTYRELPDSDPDTSQHLILVLDRRLQAFPWESLPCLEGSSVSRVGSMLSLRDCIVSMRRQKQATTEAELPYGGEGCHTVCGSSGTYILNPSSDLAPTQALLEPSLSTLLRKHGSQWNSMVNTMPSEDEFSSALTSSSVMLYFGHGSGSQYIRPRTIKRLERCSEVVWLMGCSSGAVWEYGDLEPCAVPLAYLLSGNRDSESDLYDAGQSNSTGKCMSVVATLWDVTDKDVDRFTLAVGEDWGLWPTTEDKKPPAKTPKKGEIVAQPSTPMQIPKTPKTPAARKTPAIAKTPAVSRSRPRDNDTRKLSLVEAVARSRDACVLRYLNGAAPVVYGVPVYLGD